MKLSPVLSVAQQATAESLKPEKPRISILGQQPAQKKYRVKGRYIYWLRFPSIDLFQRKIVKDEPGQFLEGRDRSLYLAFLKATATSARWKEIEGEIEMAKGSAVNNATVRNILESLRAAMVIDEDQGAYRVGDPMVRTLLLTSQIT